ncbi:16S rRNA (cytosine(1402)-N(4))-methyltransferase RsmH [Buchnera aphidicola (Kurisakia onigurumii)]|uniref:16S rRNA (cytosine(1402)-N(4))-methyltransferase RsmH n=1 Tax=Buchnera aphidicola TaxID=9 RepID=UPI0031B6EE80
MHISVLSTESIKQLKIKKNGIYIDATFGYGGHSNLILKKLNQYGKLFSIDKDPESIKFSKKIKDPKFNIIHDNFSNIYKLSIKYNIEKKIDGILLDLGISTPQINTPERGFSFKIDGPLDMRMNPNYGISAADWIANATENELSSVIKNFGEERFHKKIAYHIFQRKKIKPIRRTIELSEIITKIISHKKRKKHPATKTFQAIRIYINKELEEIKKVLKNSLKILKKGGRLVVISFHSLEDRIVKKFMNKYGKKPSIPRGLPITEHQIDKFKKIKLKIIKKIKPTTIEILKNPKSRSAILRVAEKI